MYAKSNANKREEKIFFGICEMPRLNWAQNSYGKSSCDFIPKKVKSFSASCGFQMVLFFFLRYDHPNILSGQGTLGLEIVEEVPDLDAVVIPVGGGGLLAGVAVAVKGLRPDVQIIVRRTLTKFFCFSRTGFRKVRSFGLKAKF